MALDWTHQKIEDNLPISRFITFNTSAKTVLPSNMTYSQVLEIRKWKLRAGGITQPTTDAVWKLDLGGQRVRLEAG